MENIFERACFGKPYRTRDGRKFVYLGKVESLFGHDSAIQGMIEDNDILTYYNSEGKSLYCEYKGSAINAFDIDFGQVTCEEDCETDIVSEWQDEISEEEYKNKLDELYESCVYWEAYEDEPELFAESLKELLDFAPKDKKTIDYCAYLIKSRKTILNELDNIVISFAKDKSKEITINYGNV